jgi:hypothetical protein
MKFNTPDILALRSAIATAKLADIDLVVISEGKIRGLSESRNAAIISDLHLSIDANIQLGITRLSELGKRLSLFGDDLSLEAEISGEIKIRKLSIKGARNTKIEFRCTDVAMLDKKYPKANNDIPGTVITFTKPEVALISKGIKTLGAEQVTLQVKRDGTVHIESSDASNDRFETELSNPAEFIEDSYASVFNYSTSSSGVFLTLLEHSVKEENTTQVVMMKSGNVGITVNKHMILAIPRIQQNGV